MTYVYMQQTLQTITACIHRFSMLIHRMIILTTDLLRATFSLIFCHQKLKLGKEKKQQGPTKKNTHKRQLGPFRHQHHHHTLLRRGIIFCQRSTAGTKQSQPGAHCSCLKNSKGNGRISLRLFITSQPCRRNSEFFITWKYLQQRA